MNEILKVFSIYLFFFFTNVLFLMPPFYSNSIHFPYVPQELKEKLDEIKVKKG